MRKLCTLMLALLGLASGTVAIANRPASGSNAHMNKPPRLDERLKAAGPVLTLNWGELKVGDVVSTGKMGPQGCAFPGIRVVIPSFHSHSRGVSLAVDSKCVLTVAHLEEGPSSHPKKFVDG